MRTGLMSVAGVVGAAMIAWSCAGILPHDDCLDYGTCTGLAAEGGPGGEGDGGAEGGAVIPATCDLTKSAKDSPDCVVDGVGVFVSPTGKDGARGTKADPLRSIADGVAKASADRKPRVYVCEGTYDAAVTLAEGVSIFGGLSCAWALTGAKPRLAPAKGIALRVTKVTSAIVVEDFEIAGSADPNTPSDSAIAVFVSDSGPITLRRVKLSAGAATPGSNGTKRSNYAGSAAATGGNANGALAGQGASCSCMDATTSKGGNGAAGNGADVSAGGAMPPVGAANSGSSNLTTCGEGTVGTNGAAKPAGASTSVPGSLSAQGWSTPNSMINAPNGNPAQGGGGGGAKTQGGTNAGGGGGCGGCGGAGGVSAQSGGSSFALLAFNSSIVVEGGALISGAGGAGGTGGAGQDGEPGGGVGTGACNGGPGGAGAGGTGGSGGAGGHSAPIGFVGTEPHVTGATLTPGMKGAVGPGGMAGAGPGAPGSAGAQGPEGKAAPSLAL